MANAKDRLDFWARMKASAAHKNCNDQRFHNKPYSDELQLFCYRRFLRALRKVEPVISDAEKLILTEIEAVYDSFEDHTDTEKMVSSIKNNDELMSAIFMYFELKRLSETQIK